MLQVTFYFSNTGVQQVIWDVKKWDIKNPAKLAQEWKSDLGATSYAIQKINS